MGAFCLHFSMTEVTMPVFPRSSLQAECSPDEDSDGICIATLGPCLTNIGRDIGHYRPRIDLGPMGYDREYIDICLDTLVPTYWL